MLNFSGLVAVVLIIALTDGFLLKHRKVKVKNDVVKADDTIVMTHVLFRHGNRTPELSELYPNDPYLNYTYFPFKNGQLTNAGKSREYLTGQELRARYDDLLGKYYLVNKLDSRSTDRNRTKMSLLLVLASLFPPYCSQVWSDELTWQPVPYNYYPESADPVLFGISCPTYLKAYNEIEQSPEVISELNEYSDSISYISNNTGLNITTFEQVYNLYFGFSTEQEYGLELPSWTNKVWPDIINEIAFKQYGIYTRSTLLRKMAAGYYIQKMIVDTEKYINEETNKNNTKMYLYSAHENNIGQLFATLDLFEYPHIPTYGSYVLFEVHNINSTYGFKIYYQNYNGTTSPKLLKLPACDEFCPLDTFKLLVEEYLPEDGLCGN